MLFSRLQTYVILKFEKNTIVVADFGFQPILFNLVKAKGCKIFYLGGTYGCRRIPKKRKKKWKTFFHFKIG